MNESMLKIYENALEDKSRASDEVKKTYADLNDALEAYIEAVQKDSFSWGYETAKKEGTQ